MRHSNALPLFWQRLLFILTICLALGSSVAGTASASGAPGLPGVASLAATVPPSRTKDCEHGERMIYFGLFLIVAGIILIPIGIGIPMVFLGKLLLVAGCLVWLWQMATC